MTSLFLISVAFLYYIERFTYVKKNKVTEKIYVTSRLVFNKTALYNMHLKFLK